MPRLSILRALLGIVFLSLTTVACIPEILTAGQLATGLGKIYVDAKKADLPISERAQRYAQFYCDYRDQYQLDLDDIRAWAKGKGISKTVIEKTEHYINVGCGYD